MIQRAETTTEKNFTIIFGNDKEEVDFFKFGAYLKRFEEDPSIFAQKQYEITFKITKESLNNFVKACTGELFTLTLDNAYEFLLLCNEFGAQQLISLTKDFFEKNQIQILLKELEYKKANNQVTDNTYAKISQVLYKFSDDQLQTLLTNDLSYNSLHCLLSDQKVKDCEINKTQAIFKYLQNRHLDSDFIHCLDFNKLNVSDIPMLKGIAEQVNRHESDIKKFSEIITQMKKECAELQLIEKSRKKQDDEFHGQIDGRCKKLEEELKKMEEFGYFAKPENLQRVSNCDTEIQKMKIEMNSLWIQNNPLQGLIYSLKKKKEEDETWNFPLRIVTPDKIHFGSQFKPEDLIAYDAFNINNCYYQKVETPDDNWIDFNFGEKMLINLTAVTIRSNCFGPTFSHPKHFQILGSNNLITWELIYENEEANELNGMSKCHTYFFTSQKSYHCLRYKQFETHFPYKDRELILALSAIEFFGTYQEEVT